MRESSGAHLEQEKNSSCNVLFGTGLLFWRWCDQNQDYASRWIRAAADRGLVSAQHTLGMRLGMGDGMEKNLNMVFYGLGAANGRKMQRYNSYRFETLLNSNREISKTSHSFDKMDNPPSQIEDTSTKVSREIGPRIITIKITSRLKPFLRASEQNDAFPEIFRNYALFGTRL